jgi:predicted nucleic acid-binding protein
MSLFEEVAVLLTRIRIPLPTLPGPFPRVVRDPDDDYLLAYAEIGRADFLVSGDSHLHQVDDSTLPFDIIAPAAFLLLLRERGLPSDG